MSSPAPAPKPDLSALRRRFRTGAGLITLGLAQVWAAGWRIIWMAIVHAFGVLLALIVLFEQWGWKPLAAAFAAISHLAPVAALERVISRLPPYAARVVFGVPVVLLIPLKLFALYLIAQGHTFSAAALFIAAKVIGTAIVARLYNLTGPQLLQIGWFHAAHEFLAPRLLALHDEIRSSWAWRYGGFIKAETKHAISPALARLKTLIHEFISSGNRRL